MKAQLFQIILGVHVLAGFISLLTGTLILFAKKGKGFHQIAGKFYFWGMAGVFGTTLAMLAIYPQKQSLWFFGIVAIVSFYQTFTGRRAISQRTDLLANQNIDWTALLILVLASCFAFFACLVKVGSGEVFFSVMFSFFAILGFSTAYQDFLVFSGRKTKVHWFFHHVSRMMGSFAATTTAFLVNIGPRFLPENMPMGVYLVMWIFPGVLVGFLSSRWIRQRKKQMVRQPA